jgi:hypothetical protein
MKTWFASSAEEKPGIAYQVSQNSKMLNGFDG